MSDAKSPAYQQLVESTEPYAEGPRSPPYPDASPPRPASEHRPSRRKAHSNRRLSQDGDACPLVTAHARRGVRTYVQTLHQYHRTDPRNRSEDRSCLRPSQPLSPPLGGIDECVDFHFVHFYRIARLAPVSTVRAIRPSAPPSSRRGRPDRGERSRPGASPLSPAGPAVGEAVGRLRPRPRRWPSGRSGPGRLPRARRSRRGRRRSPSPRRP